MAKMKSAYRVACPKGHTDGLQLRFVADAPIQLVDLGALPCLEPVLTPASHVEVQDIDSQPGFDGGVWCPTCDEWYEEEDCIRPRATVERPRLRKPRAGR